MAASESARGGPTLLRVFGSHAFFRLWRMQVLSATGDWLGFLAIAVAAARVGGGTPEAAVGFVVAARIVPGFFLAPIAGMFADRWNRKRLMVVCDLGRAATLLCLPFVDSVWQLVLASLVLEVFTLMWAPAKEAVVPHLVPTSHLTSANSLSLAAAYGSFLPASVLFTLLSRVAGPLDDVAALNFLSLGQEALAFYVDAATFLVSAMVTWRLPIPERSRAERRVDTGSRRIDMGSAWRDLRDGWGLIFLNPVVRAVILSLATGLIGGGMLVPLGTVFSTEVLGEGPSGFGVFITALGVGVAIGVIVLNIVQRHIRRVRAFVLAVPGAGVALIVAASMTSLTAAAVWVGVLGMFAGAVYVLGFTLLHEHVTDEFRGRVFGALFTLVRLCVLVAFAVGPFIAVTLNGVSEQLFDKTIVVLGLEVFIPGVRLTLWLAGLIILAAGALAWWSMRQDLGRDQVGPATGAGP